MSEKISLDSSEFSSLINSKSSGLVRNFVAIASTFLSIFVVGYKCFYYWIMSFIHSKALSFASKTNSCPLAAEIKQSSFQEFAL